MLSQLIQNVFKTPLRHTSWTLDVSRSASYETNLVYPFICPSVSLSLSFLKIVSLAFSDIVHDDSWPWYLVTDEDRYLKKDNWRPEFGPKEPKSGPKLGFRDFIEFESLFFIEIAYNIAWNNICESNCDY